VDGSLVWILANVHQVTEGSASYLEGIVLDITDHKLAEEARNRETTLLYQLGNSLQACPVAEEAYAVMNRLLPPLFPDTAGAVFVMNSARNLIEVRIAWSSVPGTDGGPFAPDECWALRRTRPHVVESAGDLVCQHLGSQSPATYMCIPLLAYGEAQGVLHVSGGPGALGRSLREMQSLAEHVADQIALALANLKLREVLRGQSVRDPLTGLFNRRYMEETLERELSRATRAQRALAVVLCDIDHFKRFNDRFGHEAGDAVLIEVGRLFQTNLRSGDVVCRYGGEEFVLILPEATLEATAKRAEYFRELTKQSTITHQGQSIGPVTLSFGVAAFPEHGATRETLLRAADAALYRAKASGRDRVVIAES